MRVQSRRYGVYFKEGLHDLMSRAGIHAVLDEVDSQHLDEIKALCGDVGAERRQAELQRGEKVGQQFGRQSRHLLRANFARERDQLEVVGAQLGKPQQLGVHQRHEQVQSVQANLKQQFLNKAVPFQSNQLSAGYFL